MVACRLSLTGNDLDEKSLKKVFDQITRDMPVGHAQHHDRDVLVFKPPCPLKLASIPCRRNIQHCPMGYESEQEA
jgi:hypothetical protein